MTGVKQECYDWIECFCPRCEKIYKRWLFWSGRGIPHIYCPTCVNRMDIGYRDVEPLIDHHRKKRG
jgi:hypothetical protein